MAYKGDTVKYRISSSAGSHKTVDSLAEAEQLIPQLVSYYGLTWVAVDKIETTRVLVRKMGDAS